MMKLLMKACLVLSCLVFGSLVKDLKKVEAHSARPPPPPPASRPPPPPRASCPPCPPAASCPPPPPPASCPSELAPSTEALVNNGCVARNNGKAFFSTTPTTECCGALSTFLQVANGTSCACIDAIFKNTTGLKLSMETNNMIAAAVINCTIPITAIKPIDLCIVTAPPPPTP